MAGKRGISVLDLVLPAVGAPAGAQALVPADIASSLEHLSVIEHRSTTSSGAHVHYGTLQSLMELGIPGLDDFVIEGTAITQGLPFQLILTRAPIGAGAAAIEPGPTAFQLDLFFERIAIRIHPSVLRPAKRVPSQGATPGYLIPDPSRKRVRIVGSGTLRIASTGTGSVAVTFIDHPDTFVPTTPTGVVAMMSFEPPSFFIAQSDFGLTVDRLTYDGSTTFTPPAIVARGHDETWRGLAISEATVYFPRNAPLLGDVSVGVHDVLIGSPAGMQGDLLIEFGRAPVSPSSVTFRQQVATGEQTLVVGSGAGTGGADNSVSVTLASGTTGKARIRAEIAQAPTGQPQLTAGWALPDNPLGREVATAGQSSGVPVLQTRWFEAADSDVARLTLEATSSTDTVALPEIAYTFARPTGAADIPKIDVDLQSSTTGSHTFENVVFLSGSAQALRDANLIFSTPANTSQALPFLVWDMENSPTPQSIHGGSANANFRPAIPSEVGWYHLALIEGPRRRRCRINVLPRGELVVGCEKGVFDKDAQKIPIRRVEATYALHTFHDEGVMASWGADATLASGTLTVPGGGLAVVLLERGTAGDPDATPAAAVAATERRHFQVFLPFREAERLQRAGYYRSEFEPGAAEAALSTWVAKWPSATYYVVGHTDDIGRPGEKSSDPNTRAFNKELAQKRADAVASVVRQAAPGANVYGRGELSPWPGSAPAGGLSSFVGANPSMVDPDDDNTHWQMVDKDRVPVAEKDLTSEKKDPERGERWYYRRVDVFAVGGTAATDAPLDPRDDENASQVLRLAYVPGKDLPAGPASPREPKLPWLVRLLIRWDSPTAVGLSDFIPTVAEATIAWTSTNVPLPGTSQQIKPYRDKNATTEVFTVVARWAYDPRSGQTEFSLAVDSAGDPDGLFKIVDGTGTPERLVAVALAMAPALIAGIAAAGLDGAAVRIAALLAASAVLTGVSTSGRVVAHGLKFEQRQRALNEPWVGARQRALIDYSDEIGFKAQAGPFAAGTRDGSPMRVRYKNVGIEHDNSGTGLNKWGLVYEDVSFEMEDPGGWTIEGPLGELLRVVATRAGASSSWIEVDLAFILDMGVVRVTGATIRVTFDGGNIAIALRGLAVGVEIPATLKGEGSIALAPNGDIRAGLAIDLIPLKVKARAGLAFNPQTSFVNLDVLVVFSVGIPLGNTGLGIYGFAGRFVSNGTRNLDNLPTDPIGRELAWYQRPPQDKYTSKRGQWALGVGVLVGTLPDTAFTFNALGALTVSFPEISVIFGIDAKLVSQVTVEVSEQGSKPATGTLTLLGLISIDKTAVVIAVRGAYAIPKLLSLEVPAGAYFPIPPNPADAYVRVGADNVEGRNGPMVQLRFLPDSIDIQAWSFFMVEARKLHKLGGDPDLNFDGFSIGFGAGFEIKFVAGPFKLIGTAKVLVGLGTKPLMVLGTVEIRGELNLVVVSVAVHGGIKLELQEDRQRLHGEICGSVDLWIKKIEGCVPIDIGQAPSQAIPVPDPLITGVDLTDRRGIVKGRGEAGTGALGAGNTVWPDTVPVVHFAHRPQVALPSGSAFSPGQPAAGTYWCGTTELKYAFRVDSVVLKKGSSVQAGPLDSVWWWPSHRGGVLTTTGEPASEQEGADLALLSWHPAPWARNLGPDGADAPGDPAGTVAVVCDPAPAATPVCALGSNTVRVSRDLVKLSPDAPSAGPFASWFQVFGREGVDKMDLSTATLALAEAGLHVVPGAPAVLTQPITVSGHNWALTNGYRVAQAADAGTRQSTLEFDGTLAPAVVAPELTLEVCLPKGRTRKVTVCDDFADLSAGSSLGTSLAHGGIAYQSLSRSPLSASDSVAPSGTSELAFNPTGLAADLPMDADAVRLTVAQFNDAPVIVRALDAGGTALGEATVAPGIGKPAEVELSGPGIRRIEIASEGRARRVRRAAASRLEAAARAGAVRPTLSPEGNVTLPDVATVIADPGGGVVIAGPAGGSGSRIPVDQQLVLVELCTTLTTQPQVGTSATHVAGSHASGGTTGALTVTGTRADGSEAGWAPTLVQSPAPTAQCAFVQFKAPDDGPWTSFRIGPWAGGQVTVVSVCGPTWEAVQRRAEDQAKRQEAVDAINAHPATASGSTTGGSTTTGPSRPLLDANSEYTIEVGYSYQGWRSSGPGDTPPALGSTGWQSVATQSFRFRTAAAPTTFGADPGGFVDEATFDPRGVARYLLGFEPDGRVAPHFLDDPVRVHMEVDHLQALLGKYGRDLAFRVRRTDPAAGSLSGVATPPDAPATITMITLPIAMLDDSDQRIVQAADAAPCLTTPAIGGTTLEAAVTLEPRAEYDAILAATPTATPSDEGLLIARGHFRTSRYRNEQELLRALGFETTSVGLMSPQEVLVSAALPTTASLDSDRDLDSALAALGLDPWPLARVPRTIALWRDPTAWKLVGILVEADEPIARPDRLAMTSMRVGTTALPLVRSNAAATRLLFATPAGTTLTNSSELSIVLTPAGGGAVTGRRALGAAPVTFMAELV